MANQLVTYILVNNLGGITSMLENLICYKQADALDQEAILLNIKENKMEPILHSFGNGIPVKYFSFSKKENWYHVFKKLAVDIGKQKGVLIANDVYEMLMLSYYNLDRKVIQIVHDGYNVTLALQYGDVADAFICHSYFFYEMLCQLLPTRRNDIFFIPYGVPISGYKRSELGKNDPIKLFFFGRHDVQKGIFDLIEIENYLQAASVPTDWLILGKGPGTNELKQQWKGKKNIRFATPATNDEVLQLISKRDVFVFPTRFEGFPVALVEAMSVGCVPVASNLPGGLRELVKESINGFLCNYEEPHQFAKNIEWLHNNREALELMSNRAASEVANNYNILHQSPKYQQLFTQVINSKDAPVHHKIKKKLGSRLDSPWIPNTITKLARKA